VTSVVDHWHLDIETKIGQRIEHSLKYFEINFGQITMIQRLDNGRELEPTP